MGYYSTRKVTVPADGSDTFTGKVISATWGGGMYVDLYFGGHSAPIEVINVCNDHTHDVDLRVTTPDGLRKVVREWIAVQDEEQDSGWYENYLQNSSR